MEKFFNEKCGLLYWNADLMWTFLSKKVHMWTFGAKCGPIWQHCTSDEDEQVFFLLRYVLSPVGSQCCGFP